MYPAGESLKTGYGLLCHNQGSLEAWLIRKVLGSYWNHIAVVAVINGEVYVVEAKGGQLLSRIPYEEWCAQARREIKVLTNEIPLVEVLEYEGAPYDYSSCAAHFWQRFIGKWFGSKEGKGKSKIYCFEYYCLLLKVRDWYRATPQMCELNQYTNARKDEFDYGVMAELTI